MNNAELNKAEMITESPDHLLFGFKQQFKYKNRAE